MKFKIIFLIFSIILLSGVYASTPETISFNGKLRDSSGNALNGTYSIEF